MIIFCSLPTLIKGIETILNDFSSYGDLNH